MSDTAVRPPSTDVCPSGTPVRPSSTARPASTPVRFPGSEQQRKRRRLGALGLLLAPVLAAAVAYPVHAALPSNPVHLPFESAHREVSVRQIAPEGWAFFTRNPRGADLTTYRNEGGRWRRADLAPHAEARNAFGLDRRSRAQAVELGQLQHQVEDAAWRSCPDGSVQQCLQAAGAPPATEVSDSFPEPTLCGSLTLVETVPVPWAWSRALHQTAHPTRLVSLEVRC